MMQKIYLIAFIVTGLTVLLPSCSEERDENAGSLIVNGTGYVLSYGMIDDVGLSDDNSYRNYWIRFQSSDADNPTHYIVFKLYSNSTEEIGEGTYTYTDIITGAGLFSWVKAGFDLQYDKDNEVSEGTVLLDTQVDEGSLVITKQGSGLNFEFDIVFTRNNTKYNITGNFNGTLHEGNVYYAYCSEIKK